MKPHWLSMDEQSIRSPNSEPTTLVEGVDLEPTALAEGFQDVQQIQ